MRKLIKGFVWLLLLLPAIMASAQTTSQLSGSVNLNVNFQYVNPLALGTSSFPLVTALIPAGSSGAVSYGTNGQGINRANQLYAAQFVLTNGAGRGTNWINFNTMNGATDPVGNAYAITQVKGLFIQNLGVTSVPSETNVLQILGTSDGNTWTNLLSATSDMTCPGPSSALNIPSLIWWSSGDSAWTVAASSNTKLCLTNPVSGGSPITVNVYVVGSTGL